jgi:sugar lactone lactonase YvrE
MTKLVLGAAALALAVGVAVGSASGTAFPKRIALPNGFQPEGISVAGEQFFVGSIPTGAIYRGSLRSGQGAVLVPGAAASAAIGVEVDRGRVFVAGGPTGKGFVYDARSGRTLAELTLATGGADTFVNDVTVTRRAAWFTDSFRASLYRVPLGPNGQPGGQSSVQTLPLTGDFELQGMFNANGIDATANGATLVIVQSSTGTLFTVDPRTGVARSISLAGASVPNGDGILLEGRTLYVVQNQLNRIAKIALRPNLRSGRIVRTITDPQLDVPTTIDAHGSRLYAVNARFGTAATPSTEYWVTRLSK